MGYDHRHTSVSISIHALREEGDGILIGRPSHFFLISIHALREEGDCVCGVYTALVAISIHALREEGDIGISRNQSSVK